MSDINDRYLKIKTELRPFWESLVRAVHERGLYITGFVYGEVEPPDPAGPMLLRFGNIWAETPAEMFLIHWQLAQGYHFIVSNCSTYLRDSLTENSSITTSKQNLFHWSVFALYGSNNLIARAIA